MPVKRHVATGVPAFGSPQRSTYVAAGLFVVALAFAQAAGYTRVALIAAIACLAMFAGAVLGWRAVAPDSYWRDLDAVAAGAIIAAACLLLLPEAASLDPWGAGLGVTLGLVCAVLLHVGHRRGERWAPWHEPTLAALTLHSAAAGLVIGMLYARLPALGVALGALIVAHKLPAGYTLARRLRDNGMGLAAVTWPACAVGLVAVPTAALCRVLPASPLLSGLWQSMATGLFLYVGLESVARELGGALAATERRGVVRLGVAVLVGAALMGLLRAVFA